MSPIWVCSFSTFVAGICLLPLFLEYGDEIIYPKGLLGAGDEGQGQYESLSLSIFKKGSSSCSPLYKF
jgi:hypothetical protein